MKTILILMTALLSFNTATASINNESDRIADMLRVYIKKNVSYLKFGVDESTCLEQSISYNIFEGGPCALTIHKNFNCRGMGGKIASSTSIELGKAYITVSRKNEVILFSPDRNRIAKREWTIIGESGPMHEGWPEGNTREQNDFIESIQTLNTQQASNITMLFADLIKSCRNSD